jgi:hypothetical protein
MRAIVFTSRTIAERFAADLEASVGLPLEGIPMGGGTNAPPSVGRTEHVAELIKHPSRNEWAFPDTPIVRGKRGNVPIPVGGTEKELEPDWDPPPDPPPNV